MTETRIQVDSIIIGGGIAGLWLLNRLVNLGYNAVLFEQDELGNGQTIASQGMIHGGIKYALGGSLTGESEAIAAMPGHWAACLENHGDVNLGDCNILSRHFYLWSTQSLTSKLTSFFASKMLRGRVNTVKGKDKPPVFDDPAFKGSLYKLADLVLDVPSLIETLAKPVQNRIFSIDWSQAELQKSGQRVSGLKLDNGLLLETDLVVLTAGAGNERLLDSLQLKKPAMQLRPLQQVLVKHSYPHPLYAHCMGSNPSPRLTISSHHCRDGKSCWYLGGDLATEGVGMDSAELIDKARSELFSLFPWIDFGHCEWATLPVDRAEPKQSQLIKPDKAYAEWAPDCDNVMVAWPTKLTLAPNMVEQARSLIAARLPEPSRRSVPEALTSLPRPAIATPCWESLF